MHDFNELLKPSWGAEKWILEGWSQITDEEKEIVKSRLDEMFKDGLPFELKHDNLPYIHMFSLLAQLEVLAIQIPLKFEPMLASPELKILMRRQLLDEIFHSMVFTKILYMLCAPYALPPAYSENIEQLCDFIRSENDPKIAVVLLNLISESWIEEFFYCFKKNGIAPRVFEVILDDEHRHVDEAELYSNIGLPDQRSIADKIKYMENQLATNIFLQYKYSVSFVALMGYEGATEFALSLDKKHHKQLNKINLKPSDSWQHVIKFMRQFFSGLITYKKSINEIEATPLRKILHSQWKTPADPTMVGHFNINITPFGYFSGQYPHETLFLLMLQTMSLAISENESLRMFINRDKIYRADDSHVGLIIKLPGCNDHIGTIVFKNCHELPLSTLALMVKKIRKKMVYCYKKCAELEKEHPHLLKLRHSPLQEMADSYYGCPFPGNSTISLTDLSSFGFSQAKSPLRPNEMAKVTMLEVERRPVWNHNTQEFEPQDLLGMSVSADHRVLDGNLKIPQVVNDSFNRVFVKMTKESPLSPRSSLIGGDINFRNAVDILLENNLELGYQFISLLYTMWSDDMLSLDQIFSMASIRNNFKQVVSHMLKKALAT